MYTCIPYQKKFCQIFFKKNSGIILKLYNSNRKIAMQYYFPQNNNAIQIKIYSFCITCKKK